MKDLATMQLSRHLAAPFAAALLAALLAQTAVVAQSPTRIDMSTLRPQVGGHVPGLTLNFNSASVPLSWTLTLKSLIRERPNLQK